MKKILIKQVDDAYNYGNAMMGIIYINELYKHFGNGIQIFVDFKNDEYFKYYKESGIKVRLFKENKAINPQIYSINNKFVREFKEITSIIKYSIALKQYDQIIYLGGDYFTNYYGNLIMLKKFLPFFFVNPSKMQMLGQTFGNFNKLFQFLATKTIANYFIATRDINSYNYAKNKLKVKKLFDSRDIAFNQLPEESTKNYSKQIEKIIQFKENGYITIVLSGLIEKYASKSDYITNWINTINYLINNTSYKLVILAHVTTKKKSSDLPTIEMLKKEIDHSSNRICYATDIVTPQIARNILGKSKFTITCRMHAAISTYKMLKPSIAISYSIKYKGVVSEGLGMNDLLIDGTNKEEWHTMNINKQIIEKIIFVENNYDNILNQLKPAVKECQKLSFLQLQKSFKNIENA